MYIYVLGSRSRALVGVRMRDHKLNMDGRIVLTSIITSIGTALPLDCIYIVYIYMMGASPQL